MTREQKLALIVGFALVLVVGILISDHLSPASLEEPIENLAYASPLGELPPAVVIERRPAQPEQRPEVEPVVHTDPSPPPESELVRTEPPAAVEEFKPIELTQGISRLGVRDETLIRLTGLIHGNGSEPTRQDTPADSGPGFHAYVVRKGDTLSRIAAETLGSAGRWQELAALNRDRVGADGSVREGVTLRLPASSRPAVTPAPPSRATPKAPDKPVPARSYAVKKGDTLSEIAQSQLGTVRRQNEILKLNGLDDPDEIYAGLVLKLPPR